MSLLQRLASVGLGRRDESRGAATGSRRAAQRAARRRSGAAAPAAHAAPEPVSEYAKRPPAPAPQGLDLHGRQAAPVHKPVDDDQLDIPAFLRRQAN